MRNRSVIIKMFLSVFLLMAVLGFNVEALTKEQYIREYAPLAVKEMTRTGIPASITLAQGMLESGNGNSELASKSNNHFGIKCHNEWRGKKVYYDDDKKGECFRSYKTVYESYIDHSNFLVGKNRYASLFELKSDDYKGWAKGLKKAGYATDPKYAHRLIKIIEENNLYRFDNGSFVGSEMKLKDEDSSLRDVKKPINDRFKVKPFKSHVIGHNNGVRYINVGENDSFSSITKEFGLKSWEIYAYNDLPDNASISKFRYLYIQPKRNKAHRNHSVHKIRSGESMHYISQKYGVRLKRLYKINDLKEGQKVEVGKVLQLRKRKK